MLSRIHHPRDHRQAVSDPACSCCVSFNASCVWPRPGYLSPSAGLKFADIPNGLAAVSKVPVAGWAQIAAYFGFVEFSGGFDDYKSGTPGDYGFKVLTSSDPAEKTKKLSAELANSRLAMMAIIGMFFQEPSWTRIVLLYIFYSDSIV